jgi:hypothetical protein
MRIEVLLNTRAFNASDIRPQLDTELQALRQGDTQISTQSRQVEPGELAFAEAYQFVIDHGSAVAQAIPLITAVLQVTSAVIERWGGKGESQKKSTKESEPTVVIKIEGHSMALPANDAQVKRYIKKVQEGPKPPRARAAGRKRKRKRTSQRRPQK